MIDYYYAVVAVLIGLGGAYSASLVLSPRSRYLYLPFLYSCFSKMASVFYLSLGGVYMSEAGADSVKDGSFVIFSVSAFFIVIGMFVGDRVSFSSVLREGRKFRLENDFFENFIKFVLIIYVLNVVLSGGGVLVSSAVNRFNFWEVYSILPGYVLLLGDLILFVPAILILQSPVSRNNKVFLALYFIYLVAVGQKFHGLLLPAMLLVGVYCVDRQLKIDFRKSSFFMLSAFVVGGLAIIDISQRAIADNFSNIWDPVIYRFLVLQGAAFKVFFQNYEYSSAALSIFSDIDDVMSVVADKNIYHSYVEKGVNLSVGMNHLLFSSGGYLGAFLLFFFGVFYGLVISFFKSAIYYKRYVEIFLCTFLYMWLLACYAQGGMGAHLPKIMLFVVALFFITLSRRSAR